MIKSTTKRIIRSASVHRNLLKRRSSEGARKNLANKLRNIRAIGGNKSAVRFHANNTKATFRKAAEKGKFTAPKRFGF